jgi:hypothetical protein
MFTLASCAVFFFQYLSIKEVILSFGIGYISVIFLRNQNEKEG